MPNRAPIFSDNPPPKGKRNIPLILGGGSVLVLISVLLFNVLSARPQKNGVTVVDPSIAQVQRKTIRDIISVSGVLELTKKEIITAPGSGVVEQVYVEVGSVLKPGDVILTIATDELEAQLETKKLALDKLLRQIEQTKAEREFSRRQYNLDISNAQRALADAQRELEKVRALREKDLASDNDLTAAEKNVFTATNTLEQAKLKQEQAETLFQLTMKNSQSDQKALETDIADLQAKIRAYTVRTTRGGTVYSLTTQSGSTVNNYAELAVVAYASDVRAALDVPENRVGAISKGLPVTVFFGNTSYPAVVETIAPSATTSSTSSSAVVRVTANFITKPEKPTIGASISAEIIAGTIENALVLPRGPYLSSGNYAAVYVVSGGIAQKRTATFGIVDGSFIQVAAGLEEGESVIISDYRDFIHLDSVPVMETKK